MLDPNRKSYPRINLKPHFLFCSFFSLYVAHTVGGASLSERSRRCGTRWHPLLTRDLVLLSCLIFFSFSVRRDLINLTEIQQSRSFFIGKQMIKGGMGPLYFRNFLAKACNSLVAIIIAQPGKVYIS